MRKLILMSVLVLGLCGSAFAKKKPAEVIGTSDAELKALKLPTPSDIKAVVFPFKDFGGEVKRQRAASASVYLILKNHGFQLTPLLDAESALKADKEVEPGEGMRKSDAVRIGKLLGAKWAVYGDVTGLRAYTKDGWFDSSEKTELTTKISVVDCESGDTVFWRVTTGTSEIGDGGFFSPRPDSRQRLALVNGVRESLKPLLAALPPHELVPVAPKKKAKSEANSDDVIALVNELWPKEEKAKEKAD